jgi:hypothetical protein
MTQAQTSACRSTCHSVPAFVIPSEVEESLTISLSLEEENQRCLDFARHDKSAGYR